MPKRLQPPSREDIRQWAAKAHKRHMAQHNSYIEALSTWTVYAVCISEQGSRELHLRLRRNDPAEEKIVILRGSATGIRVIHDGKPSAVEKPRRAN